MALNRLARLVRAVGPPLVSGAVMALSLPPFGFWILAFPAAAFLWWELGRLGPYRRLLAGWLFGLGLYCVGLWWVIDFSVSGAVVLFVAESLAPAVAAAAGPRGRGRIPALAGAMVLMEAARSAWPLGGLPLGGVALGQAAGPLAAAARLGGPLLLVGLVWLGGSGLGAAAGAVGRWVGRWWVARKEPAGWRRLTGQDPPAGVRRLPSVPMMGPVAAGTLAAAVVIAVGFAGRSAPDGGRSVATLRVAAVQGGGVRGLNELQVPASNVFDAQVSATQALETRSSLRPQLIVWPEDVVALNGPFRGSAEEAVLSSLARAGDATLLAGVTEPAGVGHFRNEIVALAPNGKVVDTFEKVHRVPFGEYIPWRGFVEHLANLSDVPEDAIAGHGNGVLHTPVGRLGTMVSYEVFFAERGWVATRAGATLLVVPTNTSSYSTAQVPTQEIAADRLQAISEGRDLVQAAPTGFSDLVDNAGRVHSRSSLGRRALVVGTVSLRSGRTLYERLGDLPVLLLAGAAVVGGWLTTLMAPSELGESLRRRWHRTRPALSARLARSEAADAMEGVEPGKGVEGDSGSSSQR